MKTINVQHDVKNIFLHQQAPMFDIVRICQHAFNKYHGIGDKIQKRNRGVNCKFILCASIQTQVICCTGHTPIDGCWSIHACPVHRGLPTRIRDRRSITFINLCRSRRTRFVVIDKKRHVQGIRGIRPLSGRDERRSLGDYGCCCRLSPALLLLQVMIRA